MHIDDAVNLQNDIGYTLNAPINIFETGCDKLRKINISWCDISENFKL